MSNPTSNFNWQMPTATDLVTDLPADFEVFGQAVDSSMADLLGGTTGQILAKNSNTNMDFVWITNDVGDITAVTAGTGISGGGTSGAVTITNSMATEITAKGDLVVGTGNATFDNLPTGTDGHVLTADSTVSPTGLKWAALPSTAPTFVGASIYNTASFSISNNTATRITMNSEFFDSDAFHDGSTNTARITIPSGKGGKYLVCMGGAYEANGTGVRAIFVYKNGSSFVELCNDTGVTGGVQTPRGSVIIDLAVGDFIELFTQQSSGTTLTAYFRDYEHPFQVQWLGA